MKSNILKFEIPEDGWIDNDTLMELAIIKILCDFFENELTEHERKLNPGRWDELYKLYLYFKPINLDKIPAEYSDKDAYDIYCKNILRVVKLRYLLWT